MLYRYPKMQHKLFSLHICHPPQEHSCQSTTALHPHQHQFQTLLSEYLKKPCGMTSDPTHCPGQSTAAWCPSPRRALSLSDEPALACQTSRPACPASSWCWCQLLVAGWCKSNHTTAQCVYPGQGMSEVRKLLSLSEIKGLGFYQLHFKVIFLSKWKENVTFPEVHYLSFIIIINKLIEKWKKVKMLVFKLKKSCQRNKTSWTDF